MSFKKSFSGSALGLMGLFLTFLAVSPTTFSNNFGEWIDSFRVYKDIIVSTLALLGGVLLTVFYYKVIVKRKEAVQTKIRFMNFKDFKF